MIEYLNSLFIIIIQKKLFLYFLIFCVFLLDFFQTFYVLKIAHPKSQATMHAERHTIKPHLQVMDRHQIHEYLIPPAIHKCPCRFCIKTKGIIAN